MLKFTIVLFFLCTSFSFSQSDWVLKKNKNGIRVYVREIPTSEINEFKATTILSADLEDVVALIIDGDNLHTWNYKTSDSKTVKVLSETERIIWMKNDLPWPIRNRDHVTHMKIEALSESEVKIWLLPDTSDIVPVNDDLIRIMDFKGYWLVKRMGNNLSVTHQMFGDPNGKLPTWLLNSLLTKAPYTSFSNMKKMLGTK